MNLYEATRDKTKTIRRKGCVETLEWDDYRGWVRSIGYCKRSHEMPIDSAIADDYELVEEKPFEDVIIEQAKDGAIELAKESLVKLKAENEQLKGVADKQWIEICKQVQHIEKLEEENERLKKDKQAMREQEKNK